MNRLRESIRHSASRRRMLRALGAGAVLGSPALRAVAETENVRRIMANEIDKTRLFAVQRFAKSLLDVIDTLELMTNYLRAANTLAHAVTTRRQLDLAGAEKLAREPAFAVAQLDAKTLLDLWHDAKDVRKGESTARRESGGVVAAK